MYKTALVEQQIEDGGKLISQLDSQPSPHRFPVSAGFWYYLPEAERWRLVIVSPVADKKGPHYGYTQIQNALRKADAPYLALEDVTLVGLNDPELPELKVALGEPLPESANKPLRRSRWIDDAYVYRWAL